MKVSLLYGRRGLDVELSGDLRPTLIRKHPMTVIEDPVRATEEALRTPLDSPPLVELAKGKKSACIAICDITRPVPNGILLPPLLESLEEAGVPRSGITILVATGLHRPNLGAELEEVVGSPHVMRSYRIENHHARDAATHADLGATSGGVPIRIDRRFVEAEIRIVVGLVEPHFMAGYSGGRKVVAPGLASEEVILKLHAPAILEQPGAANCVLEGNPLHREQLEIVRRIGNVHALNVVIDEERRVGFVCFGEVEKSHLQAVEFMRSHAEVRLPRRFKTVLTSGAGYPLDTTYYQTIKGMVGAIGIVEPGGTIIVASECSQGMGSRDFVEAQRLLCRLGPEGFMAAIRSRECALIDEWETEMLLKATRTAEVRLFSSLPAWQQADLGVESVSSVAEAVAGAAARAGDPEIAVIPEGPYVIPLGPPAF